MAVITIPNAEQRKQIEAVVGQSYGTWWRAPPEFVNFAYYMLLRRTYGMEAAAAIDRTRSFPGEPKNLMNNLRESVQGRSKIVSAEYLDADDRR